MTMLPMDDSMTRYTLARHPRNRAIVDIRNQTTNELKFIKIRHRLANFYAMSLVDPKTFDVWAETQVKSAGTRRKPITLQGYKDPVLLKDTSIFGLEWSFEWENQKYKWVRESPMRPTLECRAVIGGLASNVCVGRYLPRGVKDEYFGLITVLYNMVQVQDEQAMDLLLITSLMTILDKANDNSWKKEKSSGALFLEPNEIPTIRHGDTKNSDVGGTDSDSESSNNDDDGKHDEQQWIGTNGQQKATTTTKAPRLSTDDKEKGPFQQSLNESSPAHDLRSHQQQIDYLGHMLSTYSGNATATLPPSFVQHTAMESSWVDNSIGGRRSLKTMWHQNNHRTTIDYDSSSNYHFYDVHAGRQQVVLHPPSSSRPHNNPHQRIRSHRRLPSIDPHQWVPFSRQRLPPPANAPAFRNSLDLQSKPGSHHYHQ